MKKAVAPPPFYCGTVDVNSMLQVNRPCEKKEKKGHTAQGKKNKNMAHHPLLPWQYGTLNDSRQDRGPSCLSWVSLLLLGLPALDLLLWFFLLEGAGNYEVVRKPDYNPLRRLATMAFVGYSQA